MHADTNAHQPGRRNPSDLTDDRERRIELLISQLPDRMQKVVRSLRRPSARWTRIAVGLLFIVASVFSILPILGLWMLPVGVLLLAEDVKPLRRITGRMLAWIEDRRPHWMGLPRVAPGRLIPAQRRGISAE